MYDYLITTESTADMSAGHMRNLGVDVIRMEYFIDGGTPIEDDMIAQSAFDVFAKMRQGSVVTTALVTNARFVDFWRPMLEAGHDILHISFSSALSSTINCARMAAEEMKESYPDRTILVIDSLAASGGQGLLVEHAALQKNNGLSLQELCDWVEKNRLSVQHWFTVEDLEYLRRGGRVSSVAAFVGSMLKIKPVLHVDGEGRLTPKEKVNGRLASIKNMAAKTNASIDPENNPVVYICHADAKEDAEKLRDLILAAHPALNIQFSFIGTVIGAHSGPGTLAVFYRGTGRE